MRASGRFPVDPVLSGDIDSSDCVVHGYGTGMQHFPGRVADDVVSGDHRVLAYVSLPDAVLCQ